MAVIEVKFDPSIWTYTTGGTGGYSVFMDLDNTTCWCFESYGGGWAHVRLSDGAILHQDTLFGQADRGNSGGPFWFNNWYPNDYQTWFAQDGSGNYYFTAQGMTNSGFDASTYIFKFQLGSGTSGNLLNGYCADGVTQYAIQSFSGTNTPLQDLWSNYDPIDSCLWTVGGHTYFAIIHYGNGGVSGMAVVDTGTMTLVGTYSVPSTPFTVDSYTFTHYPNGSSCFADTNGVLWGGFTDFDGNVLMVSWNPTDGVSGSNLVTHEHAVPQSVHQLPTVTETYLAVIGYLPASNYLFLADTDFPNGTPPRAGTANVAIIDMSTFAEVTYLTDNDTFFHNVLQNTFPCSPAAVQCFDALGGGATPITTTSSTAFAIEGALSPFTNAQVGGVLNLVDQTSLTVVETMNVTAAINASAVSDKIVVESVTQSSGGLNNGSQYEPFTSLAWNPNINKGAACYNLSANLGSALYIFDTPALPVTGQSTTTVLVVAPNPGTPAQTITLTATVTGNVSGNPTSGTVTFYDNGVQIGSPVNVNGSGVAVYTGEFTPGTHPLTATYSGSS